MSEWQAATLLTGLWLLYFTCHSLLAANRVKHYIQTRLPRCKPCYRLFYNIFAVLSLSPIAYLHLVVSPMQNLLTWPVWAQPLRYGMIAIAIGGFIWSLHYYDTKAFTGIGECRQSGLETSQLTISPMHRYVRHPWYLFGLLLIWSRDLNLLEMITNLMITAYLFIGARLEEKKLIAEFGDNYETYLKQVPGIIPLPGKHLSKQQAEQLEASARKVSASPP